MDRDHTAKIVHEIYDASVFSLAGVTFLHGKLSAVTKSPHLQRLVPQALKTIVPSICQIYGANEEVVSQLMAKALISKQVMKTGRNIGQKDIITHRDALVFHQDIMNLVKDNIDMTTLTYYAVNYGAIFIFPTLASISLKLTNPTFAGGEWNTLSIKVNMALIVVSLILFILAFTWYQDAAIKAANLTTPLDILLGNGSAAIEAYTKNIPVASAVANIWGKIAQPLADYMNPELAHNKMLMSIYNQMSIGSIVLVVAPTYKLGAGALSYLTSKALVSSKSEGKLVAQSLQVSYGILEKARIGMDQSLASKMVRVIIENDENDSNRFGQDVVDTKGCGGGSRSKADTRGCGGSSRSKADTKGCGCGGGSRTNVNTKGCGCGGGSRTNVNTKGCGCGGGSRTKADLE